MFSVGVIVRRGEIRPLWLWNFVAMDGVLYTSRGEREKAVEEKRGNFARSSYLPIIYLNNDGFNHGMKASS